MGDVEVYLSISLVLLYADDIVVLTESELQMALDGVERCCVDRKV